MKNKIRYKGKIYERRSKQLVSGEIECPRCGTWVRVPKFSEKHFKEEYNCRTCKKELNKDKPKKISKTKKKEKPTFPRNCEYKSLFRCKSPRQCIGCYYHPVKEVALDDGEDGKKHHSLWLWADKNHAKKRLKNLDDIKKGKGLKPGGHRCYLKSKK